ncbi:227 kDa spindle- and centromere-associated protein isoform X2 [Pectinophora gossypiella]|uniref:227 kDa spindle- and centromere-associated protein isoform X2 n=1 Tax=Pectinophora gossypiella TaxID=13191 RepID=UPI00214EABA9|nr:227 kDa spindle- and centromere-associated protein isoform X2 [Pectinophora gossypiella]
MTFKTKKETPRKSFIKIFISNLKKNTIALKELKSTLDNKHKDSYDKIIDITNSVNDKLDILTKIRNDIKIYKTINTILTNHYIKETRDHENNVDNKIIKLEKQILKHYEVLKDDISKMADSVAIGNKQEHISAPIQNSNVIMVGNDLKCNQFNQLYLRNEIYNTIIKKIDKLFCGMAYQDRVKEEEQKEAETARLEEILNMCAEYERQIASGIPITPTEKRAHNKIITNGSLPRSVALNNPNFVQTSDGYYKFETSHSRNNSMSQSLPLQRNLSSYENFDTQDQLTPEVTIKSQNNYENVGRMDEIGIPVFDESPRHELSSPIMIRKMQNGENRHLSTSPVGSPYENVYYSRNNVLGLKPKSPNTQSPRTRIKTTFAHKNLPSPQYFVFPTPPPVDSSKKPNFNQHSKDTFHKNSDYTQPTQPKKETEKIPQNSHTNKEFSEKPSQNSQQRGVNSPKDPIQNGGTPSNINNESKVETSKVQNINDNNTKPEKFGGIEKQLSLEEEIPMIDDADITNDIEFRYSTAITERHNEIENKRNSLKDDVTESKVLIEKEIEIIPEKLIKNKSFDDVKKELMADIPELEEFEKDLKENKREKIIKNITEDMKKMDIEADSIDSVLDENVGELKTKYEKLKEGRKKLVTEIHDLKNKMSEIRSQEDDILRELEMEKALIKGEYDSEIAILNIEQRKKADLIEKAKKIEEEIRQLKEKQETRQNEMRDRVEIATLKVERIDKDLKGNTATLEELQNAQDILDNETKIFEDLEFQHLEEESELLANREDLQNEIILLTKKIEAQKSRILTLKSEANDNLTSALDETKILQAEYVRLLNQVEELTGKVQSIEKELKSIVAKLNDIERTQSPDSAFYTDQTRAKSGEFGYSPQSSDSDDLDITKISNFEDHTKQIKDKFNSIDRMSQSMIVDIERRVITDIVDVDRHSESPSKSSTSSKEKKGFWERNFDSLKRKKKPKSPEKVDIMSQSLNENMFYNNETIETDPSFDKFNSLRHSKKKEKEKVVGPVKSNSSSKIPTFAALGKIMKKDSFGKRSKDAKPDSTETENFKNRYVKSTKPTTVNNYKSKSLSPDKITEDSIKEETEPKHDANSPPELPERSITLDNIKKPHDGKILHRKSCGDEPSVKTAISEFKMISDSGKIPSQDDIDRISKVTIDAPLLSSDTDMSSLGKRTLDSLMEIEKKRMEMLEEQGCQVIENEREKISELKRRAQDETKKLWDQKSREQSKSTESDHCQSLPSDFGRTDSYENKKDNFDQRKDNYDQRKDNFDYKRDNFDHNKHGYEMRKDNFGQRQDFDQRKDSFDQRHDGPDERRNSFDLNKDNVRRSDKVDHRNQFDHRNDLGVHRRDQSDHRSDQCVHRRDQSDHRVFDRSAMEDSSLVDDSLNMTSSTIFEESSGLMSSSIEELQVRNSRTESTEDDKRSDDSRPLSHASDFSRDNILSLSGAPRRSRRGVAPYSESQRPLTRYLPVDRDDFDLRRHVESAGHQIELCPYVTVSSTSCRGYLHKLGAKFHTWSKRWFVFDRETKTFVYYWDKSEKKPRGGAYFQVIEEVYLDHGNTSKSPSPQTTFIVKTRQRRYYLMAPSGEAARIWIDVIFTGAQGYTEYLE